jgi:bifunctional non-homologous end joining protein LigD
VPQRSLDTYRSKRHAARTPEPVPPPGPLPAGDDDTFVIQEHHASALHWDFRLERDGVLVSWALPKGLPLDPHDNHLAVPTEDHPLEYADFHGEIAPGEYGGGQVMIWDRGRYETEKWSEREVKVVLHGERSEGRYVLFATGKNWMIHRMDPAPEGYEPLPAAFRPMLATKGRRLPRTAEQWSFEFGWPGERVLVWVDGGRPTTFSGNAKDITSAVPELREMAAALGSHPAVIDGVLTSDPAGLAALGKRLRGGSPSQVRRLAAAAPATLMAFDLLHLDGRGLLDEPYDVRRTALEGLGLDGPTWRTAPRFDDGRAVLAAAREQGLPGLVAKQRTSAYRPGVEFDGWRAVEA